MIKMEVVVHGVNDYSPHPLKFMAVVDNDADAFRLVQRLSADGSVVEHFVLERTP